MESFISLVSWSLFWPFFHSLGCTEERTSHVNRRHNSPFS